MNYLQQLKNQIYQLMETQIMETIEMDLYMQDYGYKKKDI